MDKKKLQINSEKDKKMNARFSLVLIAAFMLLLNFNIQGMETNIPPKEKTGILLVSFGSSYKESDVAFNNIDSMVRKAFPETEIRWAFTSMIIRNKLKKQGKYVDSPAEALAKMGNDGFVKVAVQSFHVIPGEEYENLQKTVSAFSHIPKGIKTIKLGKPLLFAHSDIVTLCSELNKTIPQNAKPGDAFVWMGHGTNHSSNIYYPGIQYYLSIQSPKFFLATVEGFPGINDLLPKIKEGKIKTVWLMPFMSVAGDHAQNDMAGKDPDSWKSVLESEGYDVKPVLKGLAEYEGIVNIWISHLREVYEEL